LPCTRIGNGTRRHIERTTLSTRLLLVAILATLFIAEESQALLADRIQGRAELTAIQSETDDLRNETIRQDYNANWSRRLLPYLGLNASFRYFKYDVMQEEVQSLWSRELSPRGELIWQHPHFHFGAGVSRRDSWTLGGLGTLRSDALKLSFRTRNPRWPVATLTYDWQSSLETGDGTPRDTRDQRLQAGLNYAYGSSSLGYVQTRRLSENLLPGLETEELSHQLRWSSSLRGLREGRVQLATHYSFTRTERTDRVRDSGDLLEQLALATPLYAFDTAPEFGAMEPLPELGDGDSDTPVDPPLDIGGDNEHHNLGADLGFSRPLSAVFIYTDRASGAAVAWDVFGSEDNLDWARRPTAASILFNATLNRYEIEFDSFEARYVKVVNSGLNEVAEVLVTEIEIYQAVRTDDRRLTRDSQQAQLRLGAQIHERVFAALDLAMQHDPPSGLVESRLSSSYTLTGRYDMAAWLSHHLRWEQSRQDFDGEEGNLLDDLASYTMKLDPLETLGVSLSLIGRRSWIDGMRNQEVTSAALDLRGEPAWGLNLATSLMRSRSILYMDDREYATWSFRNSVDGALTRSLDFYFSYSFRDTQDPRGISVHRQHVWGVEGRYRLARTLFASGRLNYVTERDDYRNQIYTVSWRPMPALVFTGGADLSDNEGGLDTRRFNLGANYDLNRRSALYLRYSITDLSEAGGSRTNSFQQGFRMRF